VLKKKIWANFQRIIELFTQKIFTKLSQIWLWDPGSGVRDPGSGIRKKPKKLFRIPDPGVKKAPDPGSWIRIRNTANEEINRRRIKNYTPKLFFMYEKTYVEAENLAIILFLTP
jgi:hypothetical protein